MERHSFDQVSSKGQSDRPVAAEGEGHVLQSSIMGISLHIKYIASDTLFADGIARIPAFAVVEGV